MQLLQIGFVALRDLLHNDGEFLHAVEHVSGLAPIEKLEGFHVLVGHFCWLLPVCLFENHTNKNKTQQREIMQGTLHEQQ